jgi:protein ImuA
LCLAVAASRGEGDGGTVVWSDPAGTVYPPALAAAGLDLRRLILVRPSTTADELWALAECLRCRGVSATVASVGRLSRVEARRLQLAAERGGGVGLFMREFNARSTTHYAAATRWLVRPAPGSDEAQRWHAELVHGHGGRVGQSVLLEVDRETGAIHAVRSPAAVADRPAAPAAARTPA